MTQLRSNAHKTAFTRGALFGLVVLVAGACKGDSPIQTATGDLVCDLDTDLLVSSLGPDQIPALNTPDMVLPDDPEASYLFDADRVLGVVINGEARAYPHNVLWHHEIVNDRIGDVDVSVTFCPLTGSGLAFDPVVGTRFLDVGVSGLLFANNLIFFDRITGEVYGPQLGVAGACQSFRGSGMAQMPVQEMSWGRWKELHPDTRVVSGELGYGRNYRFYPYGNYDNILSNELLFPMQVDGSRAIKERVLAVRDGDGGRGYPYGELRDVGEVVALNEVVAGIPTVVFFEAREGQSALAFDARVNGQTLNFVPQTSGTWVDDETQSTWTFNGVATGGPLQGERLQTREDAYTLFWFAWRHFQPDGQMFAAP